MKTPTTFILSLLVFVAVALGACGSQTGTLTPEQCAMNPIAASCGSDSGEIEHVQGSLGYVVGPNPKFWGDYQCTSTTPWWNMRGTTNTSGTVGGGWQTNYDYDQLNFNRGANITMVTLSPTTLGSGMDGPFHVIYNTSPVTAYLHNPAHLGSSDTTLLVTIPAYGTWIYASHERSDYPGGVQVVTFDPPGAADPNNGICDHRIQFVVNLGS